MASTVRAAKKLGMPLLVSVTVSDVSDRLVTAPNLCRGNDGPLREASGHRLQE